MLVDYESSDDESVVQPQLPESHQNSFIDLTSSASESDQPSFPALAFELNPVLSTKLPPAIDAKLALCLRALMEQNITMTQQLHSNPNFLNPFVSDQFQHVSRRWESDAVTHTFVLEIPCALAFDSIPG